MSMSSSIAVLAGPVVLRKEMALKLLSASRMASVCLLNAALAAFGKSRVSREVGVLEADMRKRLEELVVNFEKTLWIK